MEKTAGEPRRGMRSRRRKKHTRHHSTPSHSSSSPFSFPSLTAWVRLALMGCARASPFDVLYHSSTRDGWKQDVKLNFFTLLPPPHPNIIYVQYVPSMWDLWRPLLDRMPGSRFCAKKCRHHCATIYYPCTHPMIGIPRWLVYFISFFFSSDACTNTHSSTTLCWALFKSAP